MLPHMLFSAPHSKKNAVVSALVLYAPLLQTILNNTLASLLVMPFGIKIIINVILNTPPFQRLRMLRHAFMSHSITLNGVNGRNCRDVFGNILFVFIETLKCFVDSLSSLHTKTKL
jgi:hypothetical protein